MSAIIPSPPEISLESKLAFLRQATSFPEPSGRVEAIETHMSWVFLTDGVAYKLKKPVSHDVLDFRTVDARRHYCEEEVRLNRRLAADIYLGVVALTIDCHGHLQLDGQGDTVDWLVKMRRLPAAHMLDHVIRNRTVRARDMRRIAARLAAFYRQCNPVALPTEAYRAAFLHAIDLDERELTQPQYRLPAGQVRDLCGALRAILNDRQAWFDARVRAGKIVEGHGDLRPEHICLVPEIAVIDCLEFSRDLRIVDPADEIGFLALECERLGAAPAGALLLRAYKELTGDRPSAALVHFYQSYRAILRARLAIRHLDEEKFRRSAEWRRRADDYLTLAQQHQVAISSVIEPPS